MDNYDEIAEKYNESEQGALTLWRLGYPVVCELLGDISGKSVLDYGCGTGTFSRYLQTKGAIVTGVDVSENMIAVAKSFSQDCITYHAFNNGLDFLEDGIFDYVVANFVLCTIPSQSLILQTLGQINRVLKKGGKFVLMNSNWDKSNGKEFHSFKLEYCKELRSGQPITAIIKSNQMIPLHDYFWSIKDYEELLKKAWLKVIMFREEVAKDDRDDWIDEKEFPPYYVISSVK